MAAPIYYLADDEDPFNFDGFLAGAFLWRGVVYYRDEKDTTTPHDGEKCLVTWNGHRFKRALQISPILYTSEQIVNIVRDHHMNNPGARR